MKTAKDSQATGLEKVRQIGPSQPKAKVKNSWVI